MLFSRVDGQKIYPCIKRAVYETVAVGINWIDSGNMTWTYENDDDDDDDDDDDVDDNDDDDATNAT